MLNRAAVIDATRRRPVYFHISGGFVYLEDQVRIRLQRFMYL